MANPVRSEYSKLLRDPRWQKRRLEIMQRDGWKCLFCGRNDDTLNVHHLVYRKRPPWDYPDEVYQTLCDKCHIERQEAADRFVNALRMAIKNVPTARLQKAAQFLCDRALEEMESNGQ